jgi:hypothetical protein
MRKKGLTMTMTVGPSQQPESSQDSARIPPSSVIRRGWKWDKRREEAARLAAAGELIGPQIAERCKVSERTYNVWKVQPEFQARVDHHVEVFRKRILGTGFGRIENRIKMRTDLIDRLYRVIQERQAAEEELEAKLKLEGKEIPPSPGVKTGLVVRQPKRVGNKIHIELVTDAGLAGEIRAGLREIAQETGQWLEKHELGGIGGGPLVIQNLSDQELERELASTAVIIGYTSVVDTGTSAKTILGSCTGEEASDGTTEP